MNVRVVTPVGKSGVVAADGFTYQAPPKVSGVSPTSGPTAGGTYVTVIHRCDAGAVGSTVATGLVVVSDTELTVSSPAHPAAVMNVGVITPAGNGSVDPADQLRTSEDEPQFEPLDADTHLLLGNLIQN